MPYPPEDQGSTVFSMRELMPDDLDQEVIEYDFTNPKYIDIDASRGAYAEDE